MRKLLCLALMLALPLLALAYSNTDNPRATTTGSHMVVWTELASDTITIASADTSYAIPFFPLGYDNPAPDQVALHWIFVETATGCDDNYGDSLAIDIDVNVTNAGKTSTSWTPISNSNGSKTYASRTGRLDTLISTAGLVEDAPTDAFYAFTSTQLGDCGPYFRVRWDFLGTGTANDTLLQSLYVIYKWNNSVRN